MDLLGIPRLDRQTVRGSDDAHEPILSEVRASRDEKMTRTRDPSDVLEDVMKRTVGAVVLLVLMTAAPVNAAAPVRVSSGVRWDVASGPLRFDLDNGTASQAWDMRLGLLYCAEPCGEWRGEGAFSRRRERPTKAECATGQYRAGLSPRADDELAGLVWAAPDGTWLCARTDRGRVARVQIRHWPTEQEPWFRFRFRTWR